MTENEKQERKRLTDAALTAPLFCKGRRRTRVFTGIFFCYLISFLIFKTLVHILYTMKSINIEISDLVLVVLAFAAGVLVLTGYRCAVLLPAGYGVYVVYHLFDQYSGGMPEGHIILVLIPICQMVLAVILLGQLFLLLDPAAGCYAKEQRRIIAELRVWKRREKEEHKS